MSSSNEDGEIVPDFVENYVLVDGRDQPVSLSSIPLCLIGDNFELDDSTVGVNSRVYLQGTTIDGSEQIYKQVIAWKYTYSCAQPEVFVLSKGKFWIQLLKPSKRFEVDNMSMFVILHFLHFVKLNPQATKVCVWNHLESAFSSSDCKPSELDFLDHIGLIKDAFESDIDLQKSEYMCKLPGVQSKKRKLNEDTTDGEPMRKPSLVVNETDYLEPLDLLKEEDQEEEDPEEEEEEDPDEDPKEDPDEDPDEDPEEDPEEEEVEDASPLNFSEEKRKIKLAEDSSFPLRSQEKEHVGEGKGKYEDDEEEVEDYEDDEELQLFDSCCAICDNGGDILCCEGPCMRSFHPTRDSEEPNCRSLGLSQAQVDAMTMFYCKNCKYKKHQCSICLKLGSSDTDSGAEVFRCVSATCGRFYHAQCVGKSLHPENITLARNVEAQVAAGDMFTCPVHKCFVCGHGEDRNVHALQFAICRRCPKAYHRKCLPRNISFHADPERNIQQRAWDGLLLSRILIYCRDHKIIPSLGTPAMDHIVFSENSMVKNKYVAEKVATDKRIFKTKGHNVANFSSLERIASNKLSQMDVRREIVFGLKAKKVVEGLSSGGIPMKNMTRPGFNYIRKTQFVEGSSKFSATHGMFRNKEACHLSLSGIRTPKNIKISLKNAGTTKPVVLQKSHAGDINQSEVESSINSLIEEVKSSFSIDNIKSQQRTVTFYSGPRESLEKSITMGKVEATVKAVHTALDKLDNGCNIEDAMNICGPEMIDQLRQWKHKLQLHLGPFLHGARYTSYGRHFTKLEKLEEIVDMLHWYAEDGDTIVDFSCGSNDFSSLMSKKLESAGKKCFFKNFDIIQPKNDFNYERRDWFSVQDEELPIGSRLIIGLNPPFGFKAKLANQFIDKALQFKPKLVILIVPRETQRLDKKQTPYGLIWENARLLAGKSFYLPGSIDVNNKQLEQWNIVSPPLSLWSRSDWIQKHREIAMMYNHLPKATQGFYPEQNVQQQTISNYPTEGPEHGVGYEPQYYNHMLGRQPQTSMSHYVPENNVKYEAQDNNHLLITQPQISMLQNVSEHGVGYEPQDYSHMLNTQPQFSILQNFPEYEPQNYSHMLSTHPQSSMLQNVLVHGVGYEHQNYSHVAGTQAQNGMLQNLPTHGAGYEPQHYNPLLGTPAQVSTNDGKL